MADFLEEKVRILCWVATHKAKHDTNVKAVKQTWGQHCSLLLFFSDFEDSSIPTMNLEGVPAGYDHLTAKTMVGFDYVYKHYSDQYDWFMKADDDTFVIVENLRYLLFPHLPTEAVWFGSHFDGEVPGGYHSGGAGYVVSREALRLFSERKPELCAQDNGPEDVQFGKCMGLLGVKTGDSHDPHGRTQFHAFEPETHIVEKKYHKWFYSYDVDKVRTFF